MPLLAYYAGHHSAEATAKSIYAGTVARKATPLLRWSGYAPGLEDAIRAVVPPTERVRPPILEWLAPPLALKYPAAIEVGTQTAIQVVVTDRATHMVALEGGDSRRVVWERSVSADQVTSVTFGHATRKVRQRGHALLGEAQEVVILWLQSGNNTSHLECRYEEATEQCRFIQAMANGAGGSQRGSQPGVADELEKLARLRDEGVLTPEDWERAKSLFLGKPADRRQEAVVLLSQLHNLYRAGALSESEFNAKKWDVLSRS
jgi:hypothetical protein